jgi:hypothetical protein
MDYSVDLIERKTAQRIIVRNHYTKTWSSCVYSFGLFDPNKPSCDLLNRGELLGVAVFGKPIGRNAIKSITSNLTKFDVLELTRLWIIDGTPKNSESFFLGKTFKWLRENTDYKILISYADPIENHIGIIYQATNWWYQDTKNMTFMNPFLHWIDGKWRHQRSVTAKYGTIKNSVMQELSAEYKRKELPTKHRYIYVLHKKDRKRIKSELKYPCIDYPKNKDKIEWKNIL